MSDVNNPNNPEELLNSLKFYKGFCMQQLCQQTLLENYIYEHGPIPEEYTERIRELVK